MNKFLQNISLVICALILGYLVGIVFGLISTFTVVLATGITLFIYLYKICLH